MRVNPFDIRTVVLAKYAQHVGLIHFPVALFITAVAFDYFAQWTKNRTLAAAAYFNLLLAAVSTMPVVATGFAAWQWALEGQQLKGILLMHLVLGLHIECADLACLLDPLACARHPVAPLPTYRLPRSSRCTTRGVDGASRRVSQWRERARLDAPETMW